VSRPAEASPLHVFPSRSRAGHRGRPGHRSGRRWGCLSLAMVSASAREAGRGTRRYCGSPGRMIFKAQSRLSRICRPCRRHPSRRGPARTGSRRPGCSGEKSGGRLWPTPNSSRPIPLVRGSPSLRRERPWTVGSQLRRRSSRSAPHVRGTEVYTPSGPLETPPERRGSPARGPRGVPSSTGRSASVVPAQEVFDQRGVVARAPRRPRTGRTPSSTSRAIRVNSRPVISPSWYVHADLPRSEEVSLERPGSTWVRSHAVGPRPRRDHAELPCSGRMVSGWLFGFLVELAAS